MKLEGIRCEDKELVKWFKEHWSEIEFIKREEPFFVRKKRLDKINKGIDGLKEELPLHKQRNVLKELWKYLVSCAVIYLKFKDDREGFHDDGDFGLDELEVYFDEFCKFESNLYGSSEFYRDHLSHLFKVFLLGEYLLRGVKDKKGKVIGFDKLIVGDEKLPEGLKVSAGEKEAMWCIAALTHDLGYPLEKVHKIFESSRNMIKAFEMETTFFNIPKKAETLDELIIKFLSSTLVEAQNQASQDQNQTFLVHIQPKVLWKLTRAWEQFDHGVSSALLLFKKLVFFLESDYCFDELKPLDEKDAKQFLIRNQILRANAFHNCNYIYHLRLLDFAFFLRIIDEMQEWGRPRLQDLFETYPDCEVTINELHIKDEDDNESKEENKNKVVNWIAFAMRFAFNMGTTAPPSNKALSSIELNQIRRSIGKAFLSKAERFIEILRSGVGGRDRNFQLIFYVEDQIEPAESLTYAFGHFQPDLLAFMVGKKVVSLEGLKEFFENENNFKDEKKVVSSKRLMNFLSKKDFILHPR